MPTKIRFMYPSHKGTQAILFIRPTVCPKCHAGVAVEPCYKNVFEDTQNNSLILYSVTECYACNTAFVSVYDYNAHDNTYHIKDEYPQAVQKTMFQPHICEAYPDFVSFYHQSEHAEQLGLLDICGTGYRKALEFLIKTYLIEIKKLDQEIVEQESLGNCIGKIDNNILKKCAQNAARLGNDQTHYRKKYKDHDIQDLKWYINNVVQFINLEYTANQPLLSIADQQRQI